MIIMHFFARFIAKLASTLAVSVFAVFSSFSVSTSFYYGSVAYAQPSLVLSRIDVSGNQRIPSDTVQSIVVPMEIPAID